MTKIRLGLDLNCLTNRYTLPEEWVPLVAELGIKHVQFNADLLDPMLPWEVQAPIIERTRQLCAQHGIAIDCSFGGHAHHQHYLGHPEDAVASWYEGFYARLIAQTAMLGGKGTGTCYAIMGVRDADDPVRKRRILERAAQAYHRIARIAKEHGLAYLMFETTSVPRESCATFAETDAVLGMLQGMAVPMRLCLDVGHRNMADPHAPEANPYEWIRRYGRIAPVIHIQQTNTAASQHWPFTDAYNAQGDIDPAQVIAAVEASGADEVLLALEVNHKAFHPTETKVLENLKASVAYWRRYVHG